MAAGTRLYGRGEVRRLEQVLQRRIDIVDGAKLDGELSANYARYLCVLVAGFAEQSLKALLTEHARTKASSSVHRYVEQNVNRVWGINQIKLKEALDGFDLAWYPTLTSGMEQEISSLQSVGKLRDNISHGNDAGITLLTMKQYSADVIKLIRKLCDILDPISP